MKLLLWHRKLKRYIEPLEIDIRNKTVTWYDDQSSITIPLSPLYKVDSTKDFDFEKMKVKKGEPKDFVYEFNGG